MTIDKAIHIVELMRRVNPLDDKVTVAEKEEALKVLIKVAKKQING